MKSAVTFGFAALLALPAVSCAQDRRPETGQNSIGQRSQTGSPRREATGDRKSPDTSGASSRRLESVTWNSVKHELTWVVSKGEKKEGAGYKPLGSASYLINMDEATMKVSGETRRFSKEEAANVYVLMDLIAKYAVDSTVWWDDGQGEPVNGDGKGTHEPEKPRHRGGENEDLAILHVAAGSSQATRPNRTNLGPRSSALFVRKQAYDRLWNPEQSEDPAVERHVDWFLDRLHHRVVMAEQVPFVVLNCPGVLPDVAGPEHSSR